MTYPTLQTNPTVRTITSRDQRYRRFLAFGFTERQAYDLAAAGYGFTTLPKRDQR